MKMSYEEMYKRISDKYFQSLVTYLDKMRYDTNITTVEIAKQVEIIENSKEVEIFLGGLRPETIEYFRKGKKHEL